MLPASLKWANTAAVVVGLQIAIAAIIDFRLALNIEDVQQFGDESQFAAIQPSLEGQREILLAQRGALQSAIGSMRPWRLVTEALLAATALAVFVIGLRLRVASEGRPDIARWLGRAAIGAAVMRSIDGAQNLVIARGVSKALAEVLVRNPPPALKTAADQAQLPVDATTGMVAVASVGVSLFVVGVFMALATYFRSERLQDSLLRAEP